MCKYLIWRRTEPRYAMRLNLFIFSYFQLVGRSLFCLGLLIRYGKSLLTDYSNKIIDVVGSLSLFKKYLLVEDFIVKVRSLQVHILSTSWCF